VPGDFAAVLAALKPALARCAKRLTVQTDTPSEYKLVSKSPSPFPQHKGHPLLFASIVAGKNYASFHLMPVYRNARLTAALSPGLKRHKHGEACFQFKTTPDPAELAELKALAEAGLEQWPAKAWL